MEIGMRFEEYCTWKDILLELGCRALLGVSFLVIFGGIRVRFSQAVTRF